MSKSRSKMQPTTSIPPSSKLSAIHATFHLIFVRNKNQHSHAKWWKHLSLLRRSLRALHSSMAEFEKYVDGEGIEWIELKIRQDGRIVDADGEAVGRDEKVVEVARYLWRWIIPRAYVAFSTVVADTQFSVLGVVLIAALAELANAIKEFATADEEDSQVEEVANAAIAKRTAKVDHSEDFGEVIVRQAEGSVEEKHTPFQMVERKSSVLERDEEEQAPSFESSKETTTVGSEVSNLGLEEKTKTQKSLKRPIFEDEQTSVMKTKSKKQSSEAEKKERKKKKKKKANAIDDIFGGL